jgi:predicted secreted protein
VRRTIVALVLALAFPATASAYRVVKVGGAANGKTVRINLGDVLTVSLPGDPSSQYRWFVQSVNPKELGYALATFYASTEESDGPGMYALAFKAIGTGKSRLELDYVPNGTRTDAELTFAMTVVVSGP